MGKYILLFMLSLFSMGGFAQERSFTDKEHGGSYNGILGKINDELNVTSTGQLSYEIPIPALPGTGGMKPNVSVSYNSSTKSGLAGYGFDITGLPIIGRVPSDRFHDGMSATIDFTNNKFSLDGQRLVCLNRLSDTQTEYRTENNSFARILANGKSTNPESFRVNTKSGLVYDYVSVSKALNGSESESTLFWLVERVTDTKGNYLTVSYGGDAATNDFYPVRIDYTGNTSMNLSPYASIAFEYIENPYSAVTYVNGVEIKRSRIVSSIRLLYGNKTVRIFEFNYQTANRRCQLSRIDEKTPDGEHKNPTFLSWYALYNYKAENVYYSQTEQIHKAKLTVGDFNGDGMDDFIATPENNKSGWKGWRLFISRGSSFVNAANGTFGWPDNVIEQVVCGDFNGDGYTDVVVKRRTPTKYYNCDLYIAAVDGNGNTSLKFSECFLTLNTDFTIQPVELNGDGATDLIACLQNSKECRLISSSHGADGIVPLCSTVAYSSQDKWDRVEFGDFNGDGLTDIMNLTADGYSIMYSTGYGGLRLGKGSSRPDKYHYIEFGDFNGDGKTDMLLTGSSKDKSSAGWSDWSVYHSRGDGTFALGSYPKAFDARSKQLYVADFNGDGFDDIQCFEKTSTGQNMTTSYIWLCDGNGNFYRQMNGSTVYAADKWHFYLGDFNGDGKTDFVCTSDWGKSNWDGCQLYLMPSDMHDLLSSIQDGLGNTTRIGYKYLSDKSVFTRGNTQSYPLVSIGSSWPVVASVTTPDGIGGQNTVSYRYEDALFHKDGKGLLGFAKCQTEDETTGIKTTTEYEVNRDKYVIAQHHSQTSINGKLLEEHDYTYSLQTNYNSRYIYTYMPAYVHLTNYEYNTGETTRDIKTWYEYDNFGNVTKTTVADGDLETTTVNAYDNDTGRWFLGRLTESTVTKSNGSGSITRSSSFSYDRESGLLTTERFLPSDTRLGYSKTYIHDGFGNITESRISPFDGTGERVTRTAYDEKGRFLFSATNSLGFTETSAIDNSTGLTLKTTDANGITTNYAYNPFGTQTCASTPVTKSLSTTGWSNGMADAPANALYFVWKKTTGMPYTIEFYDCLGRLLRKVTESLNGKKVYVDCLYNKKGQTIKTSEPYFAGERQYWNSSEYDDIGRTTKQIAADGSFYTFDFSGLKTVTTDPLGHTTTKACNLNGLLESSTDNNGTKIEYKYDADGNCIETRGPRTTVGCSYDAAGNRIRMDDPDSGLSEDTYNAFGELVLHRDSHGETMYEYDTEGRTVCETRPDVTITTRYDRAWKGAVDETICSGKTTSSYSYIYDGYGRIKEKHTAIGDNTFTTAYTYNADNKIKTVSYPHNLNVRYDYDASGIMTAVSNSDSACPYWTLTELDARGQVEKEMFGNGIATTTAHTPQTGTVKSIVTPGIQKWEYAFDAAGNLISRRDLGRNLVETFSYDGLNRLTEVSKNGQTTQVISYDEAGNITEKSNVGKYQYADGSNRLSSIVGCKVNILSWKAISYSSFDKITSIESGGKVMTIEYGPDKSRVSAEIKGTTKYYVDNLFEQKAEGNITAYTNYIYALGKVVAIVTQGVEDTVRYIHRDHLGSIQAFSTEDAKLCQELSYDAWGLRRNPDTWTAYTVFPRDISIDDHGFGGHEHIDVFDLINMDGRMYDPLVGRFISADPIVQSPDMTQSLNRYAYCVNNPLSLIDSSGYSWFSKNWKTITAAVVGIAVSVITLGSGSSVGAAIIAGGAAGALTGSLLNGANIGQVAKSTFTGALWGAASGFLNFASGDGTILEQLFKHTFSQGWIEGVQGGNMLHGFMMGAASSVGGTYFNNNYDEFGYYGKLVSNSVFAGTIEEIGGGKFANGAVTGAFAFMFNHAMHKIELSESLVKKIYGIASDLHKKYSGRPYDFYKSLGGEFINLLNGQYNMSNTCASKLSEAMRIAGIKIPRSGGNTIKGTHGYYYANAKKMSIFFREHFKRPGMNIKYDDYVKYGIVFQTGGFSNASGHVDVMYKGKAAGTPNGNLFPNQTSTILWK